MPTTIDPDADWFVFDNTERVTFYPFDTSADAVSDTGTAVLALKFMESKREESAPSGGQVAVRRRAWHLRAAALDRAGVAVTRRGEVEDSDGVRWVVEEVDVKTWGTRYTCHCHRLT